MGKMKEQASASIPVVPEDVVAAIEEAVKPLDRIAVAMEGKWGAGRLARLVSPETAARFGAARDKLNAAIHANDVAGVTHRAAVLMRGWQALDAEATANGAAALPPKTWSVSHEGQAFTVVLDRADVHLVARLSDAPERVVTVSELLVAWRALRDRASGVEAVKRQWPGAMVARLDEARGDELGF
jgi:hypothetical protein